MNDANLIAFGAAVFFTALVGGYVYIRGNSVYSERAVRAREQRRQPVAQAQPIAVRRQR